jgi:hypothetical protein
MKSFIFFVATLLAVAVFAQTAQAQGANGGDGWGSGLVHETQCPPSRDLAAISGIISASIIGACMTLPAMVPLDQDYLVGTGFYSAQGVINVQGPDIVTAGLAAFTITTVGFTGCTYGSENIASELLAQGTGAAIFFAIRMDDNVCRGQITLTVTAGLVPVTLATIRFAVNIVRGFDNCASSSAVGTCIPEVSTNFNYGCNASNATPTTGVSCNTPFVKNSVAITSWPVLNAILSGGVALTGSLTIHQDPISGSLTIHQDPISGELSICPEFSPCFVNSNSTAIINGNSTTIENNDFLAALTVAIPLLLFVAIIVWAEFTREFILYIVAILAGIIVILGTWAAINADVRTVLVLITAFLAVRAYYAHDEIKNQDV